MGPWESGTRESRAHSMPAIWLTYSTQEGIEPEVGLSESGTYQSASTVRWEGSLTIRPSIVRLLLTAYIDYRYSHLRGKWRLSDD